MGREKTGIKSGTGSKITGASLPTDEVWKALLKVLAGKCFRGEKCFFKMMENLVADFFGKECSEKPKRRSLSRHVRQRSRQCMPTCHSV